MVRLTLVLRASGVTLIAFFVLAAPLALAGAVDHRSLQGRLLMWHGGGSEYVVMISAINIALGIGLLVASGDPAANRPAIDLAIGVHCAHMAAMTAMAVAMADHRSHLLGDVPMGLVMAAALLATWIPVRANLAAHEAAATQVVSGSSASSAAAVPSSAS